MVRLFIYAYWIFYMRLLFRCFNRFCWYLLTIIIVLLVVLFYSSQPSMAFLGVYDPSGKFNHPSVTIEHHFVPWRPDSAQEIQVALRHAEQQKRIPMITLEPWPWNIDGMNNTTLLEDVSAGKYDETIDRSLRTIQQTAFKKVLLRWGHEMEIVGQYPWSVDDPKRYVAAYRHMVNRSRQLGITNILWIWSPAGNSNAVYYWPGEDVVDIIGISIYATVEWHPDGHNSLPSFDRLMQQKYGMADALAKRWHKPMMVAEVGVNANPDAQQAWLKQAIHQLGKFPDVVAWVYFNQIQPMIVPLSIGQPDWSLKPQQVENLEQNWPLIQDQQKNQLSSLTMK